MDYSPLDFYVHGISQTRILEGVAHFLLWGILSTQGLTLHLLLWQVDSLPLHHLAVLSLFNPEDFSVVSLVLTYKHRVKF